VNVVRHDHPSSEVIFLAVKEAEGVGDQFCQIGSPEVAISDSLVKLTLNLSMIVILYSFHFGLQLLIG
jgi:hypothetical protein